VSVNGFEYHWFSGSPKSADRHKFNFRTHYRDPHFILNLLRNFVWLVFFIILFIRNPQLFIFRFREIAQLLIFQFLIIMKLVYETQSSMDFIENVDSFCSDIDITHLNCRNLSLPSKSFLCRSIFMISAHLWKISGFRGTRSPINFTSESSLPYMLKGHCRLWLLISWVLQSTAASSIIQLWGIRNLFLNTDNIVMMVVGFRA